MENFSIFTDNFNQVSIQLINRLYRVIKEDIGFSNFSLEVFWNLLGATFYSEFLQKEIIKSQVMLMKYLNYFHYLISSSIGDLLTQNMLTWAPELSTNNKFITPPAANNQELN